MTDPFYRAFEDRFRGSREEVMLGLAAYLPWLQTLKANVEQRQALDIGCGRGEWLEQLSQAGFDAMGVDTDAGMLAASRDRGLHVHERDGLEVIEQASDDSLALVSMFHVVEHLSFDHVRRLIEQAYRVLTPGGLLIMETPNSENIGVGTWNFYLDPTHERPIPHQLLEFATRYAGFEDTHILRMNHDPSVLETPEIGLLDVLCHASPDYAVIGMKPRLDRKPSNQAFADCIAHHREASLETLARRYDDKYSAAIRTLAADVYAINARLDEHQQTNTELPSQQCQTFSSDPALQMQELQDIYNSTSWRITKPLRWVGHVIKRLTNRHG